MKKEDRCAQNLNLLQEDALIGLMWEDFNKNDMKHLDYDKVRRFAVSIQTDGEICGRLDAEAVAEEQAWEPPDAWITDMCLAFINAAKEEKKKERESAFGGPKFEYDPKVREASALMHLPASLTLWIHVRVPLLVTESARAGWHSARPEAAGVAVQRQGWTAPVEPREELKRLRLQAAGCAVCNGRRVAEPWPNCTHVPIRVVSVRVQRTSSFSCAQQQQHNNKPFGVITRGLHLLSDHCPSVM